MKLCRWVGTDVSKEPGSLIFEGHEAPEILTSVYVLKNIIHLG
jgi:hypothetical protein